MRAIWNRPSGGNYLLTRQVGKSHHGGPQEDRLMKPLRPIDWDAAHFIRAGGYKGQVLFGGESCQIIATLVPPGTEGPPTHVHTSDQIYFIIEGELEIELGSRTEHVSAGESILIPAGLPHHNRNVSDTPETHLEIIAPGVVSGKPLAVFLDPDEVDEVVAEAEGRGLTATIKGPDEPSVDDGVVLRGLIHRSSGSEHAGVFRAELPQDSAAETASVNETDRFAFVLDGELDVEVGSQRHTVGPNTLVLLPAGVPHRQWNSGDRAIDHLAIRVPE